EERVLLEVGDHDLHDPGLDGLEDVLDQVVGHGTGRGDLLELQRDRVGLEDPHPDGQGALVLLVLEDDDRHVGQRIQREPADFHLEKHWASSGVEARAPRRLWGSASVTRTWTTSPIATRLAPWKFTTRLHRVRPDTSASLRFEPPSTRTSTVSPSRRRLRAA